MDSLEKDRDLIERVLCECARFYSSGETRTVMAFDRVRDQYLILDEGWDGSKRIHFVFVHVELRGGEVWIQKDGTQEGIGVDLIRAGLPESRLVPAFQPPPLRQKRALVAA